MQGIEHFKCLCIAILGFCDGFCFSCDWGISAHMLHWFRLRWARAHPHFTCLENSTLCVSRQSAVRFRLCCKIHGSPFFLCLCELFMGGRFAANGCQIEGWALPLLEFLTAPDECIGDKCTY